MQASTVSFALDKSAIDFGKVVYVEKKDEEIVIFNDGRVPFNYSITMDPLSEYPG